MASKRVELAKQQQKLHGIVQINTNVDDAQKFDLIILLITKSLNNYLFFIYLKKNLGLFII